MPLLFIFLVIFSAVLVGIVVYFISRRAFKKRLFEQLGLKLFLIRLPREKTEGKELKQEIARSEQLLGALSAFRKPFTFEVAVPYVGEEIHFYAAIEEGISDAFVRQIQALWEEADVRPSEDYNIFNYSGAVAAAKVVQKNFFGIPLRTYNEANSDTFLPMLGGFSKISEVGEGGALQIIARPAKASSVKEVRRILSEMRKGKKFKEITKSSVLKTFDEISKTISPEKKEERKEPPIVEEAIVKALEAKLIKPFFEVNVRVLASAPSEYQAHLILEGLAAGFSQFSAPERNELKVVEAKKTRDIVRQYSFREFNAADAMTLNSEELASIFHFPTPFTSIPKIKHLKFREVPPPPNLPEEGVVLGENRFRNQAHKVRMLHEDRRRHLYAIGQTGTGKSVFLNNLSGQDIENGEGVCVIDPNGDLFEDVLARVPEHRAKDVIIFDPSDLARPIGLNMLEYDPAFPEHKTFIVNEMLNIFDTLYDLKTTGGPIFEQYLRFTLLLLMDDPSDGFTILDVPRVLADSVFRKRLLEKCKNPIAKDFWEKEAEKAGGEASLANLVPYITSKFNTFIGNDYVRPVISQSKSTINFRKIMDEQKILLVNLSKGKIGELNAGLLGMIIVGKLTLAAFSRTDIPMESRKDFYLYIDEFQSFTTPSISTILSEARKYRLCLTVAHQFIAQLKENIRNAIFGNVGSIVAFRVGAQDAEFLKQQFAPVFDEHNLVNIDNLNAHVKLIIANEVTAPFTMFVPFPPKGVAKAAEAAREMSRMAYGRPREDVEAEAYQRLKS
ncbi:MAG: type IV secretion system DNA-binding domain-containing protein [Candidatus Jorgensenbacteria bacterium]|nr:type IV secretion system DNA-binding domain-containing protein [Candidatus Jorgensenbacteria bacterium]